MSSKRRDFHDLGDDEDEESDTPVTQEDSRFSAIPHKRRRLNSEDEQDASEGSEAEEEEDEAPETTNRIDEEKPASKPKSKAKHLTPEQLEKARRKAKNSGVIYVSRVPPFMKPVTLRNLLTPFGDIGRIFLTPEAAPSYLKRVRSGGNRKRSFLDGWVEFASKKKAKACVELLNGNIIGGKKGGFYHDDIWNIKYLKGFKWSDLMEQVQGEEKMREGRLRAELTQDARDRKYFERNLELAKKDRGVEATRQKRAEASRASQEGGEHTAAEPPDSAQRMRKFERDFKQNEVKGRKAGQDGASGNHIDRLQSRLL